MIARLAAAGFLFFAAGPAAASPESEGLVRDFIAWVDSSGEWSASVGALRSEGNDTFAEGVVMERQAPRVSISIETLRLKDLAARDGGGFAASEIELTGGAVLADELDSSIPSATVRSISLPSLGDVTLDPKHLMTSIARFYSVAAEGEVAELKIPELSLTQSSPATGGQPSEVTIVYRNLSLTGMTDGVVQRQEIGPTSVTGKGSAEETFDFEIARIEADNLDLGAAAHVLDANSYADGRGDNVWRPIVARAAYSGISGNGGDGGTFKVDEIAIENIDGRQPDEPFTEVWDRLIDPEIPEDAKDDIALEAMTGMFSAWRVGTIRIGGTSLDAPKDNATFSLASMTFTGWSSEGLDSFIIEKLRGSSPDGFLSVGSLELAGFVAPDLKALMKFAAIEKDLDIAKHADAIKDTFAALPRLAHFGLRDVAAGESEADSVSLSSFSLDFTDWNSVWAGGTEMRLDGLSIPRHLLELDQPTTEIFSTLGYDSLVLGMSVSDRWKSDAGTDDAVWRFSMKDAADIELSYSLTGITLDWLVRATAEAAKGEDSQEALLAMVNEIRVASAKVSVTDRSLLDRGFKVAAEKQGLKVEGSAYREQMRAALPFLISAAVPTEIAKLVTAPVQSFLAGGQTIHADVQPVTPLSLMDLMAASGNPVGLPALLNLTLRSEAPTQQ